jgi:hypothetical protein
MDPFWNWVALPSDGDELIKIGKGETYWYNERTFWGSRAGDLNLYSGHRISRKPGRKISGMAEPLKKGS